MGVDLTTLVENPVMEEVYFQRFGDDTLRTCFALQEGSLPPELALPVEGKKHKKHKKKHGEESAEHGEKKKKKRKREHEEGGEGDDRRRKKKKKKLHGRKTPRWNIV